MTIGLLLLLAPFQPRSGGLSLAPRGLALPSLTFSTLAQAAPRPAQTPSTDVEAAARQRAIEWLHNQQLPDGSFGMRMANGGFTGDPGSTADVIYVLALAGEDPGGPIWTVNGQSALQALERLAPDYAKADSGQAGKVARAVAVAGGNPRSFAGLDLVSLIESWYDPATGRYNPQLLFRHSLAVEGLARAGAAVPPAAYAALWQARLPDGGWFWAFDGQQSDLDTTGRVMQVLGSAGGFRCSPLLAPAAGYVAAHQDAVGGWGATTPPGPPNANSSAMAAAGLRAAGYDLADARFSKNGKSPMDSLLAFQEPSGAFAYMRQPGREEVRLAATIDAMTALLSGGAQAQTACGPVYLPVDIVR